MHLNGEIKNIYNKKIKKFRINEKEIIHQDQDIIMINLAKFQKVESMYYQIILQFYEEDLLNQINCRAEQNIKDEVFLLATPGPGTYRQHSDFGYFK